MNQFGKLLLLPAFLALGSNLHGVAPENRYNTIVGRNIFRLTSPPPPAPPPKVEDEALTRNIELSGISTVDGQKKAWFVIRPKTGSKDTPKYVSLAEQEEQEFLRVVAISEGQGEVNVLNSGNAMVLSFKNNGTKAVAGPPPAPAIPGLPGAPVASVIAQPQAGGAIAGAIAGALNPIGAAPAYSGRPVTVTGGVVPVATAIQGNTAQQIDSGFRSIPSRQLRLSPIGSTQAPQQVEPPVDPVRQRQIMDAQQAVFNAAGESLPPLPPLITPGGRSIPVPPSLPQ